MEAVHHRDDPVPSRPAVEASKLNRRLDRLRTAVAEEALAAEAAALAQRLGQPSLSLGVPGVGHVNQLADLVAHRLDDSRRTVAEQVAAPARKEVEVAVTLGIPHPGACAARQANRIARVVADDVTLEQVNDFWGGSHENQWFVVRGSWLAASGLL